MSAQGELHVESREGYVVLRLDHPTARNALTDDLLDDLADAAEAADVDPDVRAIVVAGSDKVFASGADLRSLVTRTAMDAFDGSRTRNWAVLRGLRTPTVAAVSGFCLGGGAELAMMCDVVVAAPTLRLGLPETMLGLLPGAGGTQMLPRAVGKAVAMDLVLTGRLLDADEALAMGVVSRIAPVDGWLELAEELAATIASRSSVAQRLAKQAVRTAFESGLTAGVEAERTLFSTAFGSQDAAEGIDAFLSKRTPEWKHA
ncbi:enoyl-CoA hydratase-related protein [Nocardioides hwasunensis]|uniref:Enoyl-CoA hydratase/isomerase family protein n=1 Tax=Nocardioides hwasunensis TaxID=397258 RepID=A0ABR8MLZ6_9ACTN|nr:enoyl-CoA hydratase-related protein [Nocardioides hwasunensis]MBD3917045.1 enoyl-CoA hydratase/isomerase family protein [Nocardioides hwasunensis]